MPYEAKRPSYLRSVIKEKTSFSLYYARLFFTSDAKRPSYLRSVIKEKTSFFFVLRSLIRTFAK